MHSVLLIPLMVWRENRYDRHIGMSSFYPPHHMTMGEGGAVYTNDPVLSKLVNSFRDWGRDCWCVGGLTIPVSIALVSSLVNYQLVMTTNMYILILAIT